MPESVVEALEWDLSVAPVVAAPRPTRRLVLSGVRRDEHDRPEQREHGASTECSDTVSVGVDTHSDSELGSSFVSEEEEEVEVPVVAGLPPVRPSVAAQRSGYAQIDRWNVQEVFARRASVMRTVPRFLWGSFRVALKVALEEVLSGQSRRDVAQQERGWKLFLLLPRMLLHRSPRGGPISRDKLIGRFDQFASSQWHELLVASQTCAQEAATAYARRKRRNPNNGTHRTARFSGASCHLAGKPSKELNWRPETGSRSTSCGVGRDQVWPNPSVAKFGYQVWPNQVWPRPSLARPSLAKTKFGQTKFGQDQVWPDQVWPRRSLARPSAGQSI